jgi:uncharacterized membrane protein
MKYLLLLVLPLTSFATTIPMDSFDQLKLEETLRAIPAAADNTKGLEKTYSFPKDSELFKIRCKGQHFKEAKIPTSPTCEIDLKVGEAKGYKVEQAHDQWRVQISEEKIAKRFFKVLQQGKLTATEQVYAGDVEGVYANQFRYQFLCEKKSCTVVFLTKPAKN